MKGATGAAALSLIDALVSIRAPREGGDGHGCWWLWRGCWFQSAPPVKGATTPDRLAFGGITFQSAPPVKGATVDARACGRARDVSIRAPREGGDFFVVGGFIVRVVSIRAPREGGDCGSFKSFP